jgi:hypothetical protein
LWFKVYLFTTFENRCETYHAGASLVLSHRRTKMSKNSRNFSQDVANRKLTCAVLGLCVLIAAPASFAQRAGGGGPITLYDFRQAETEPSCLKPISPAIPEQDISKRIERQVKRDMREYLDETGYYIACVRTAVQVGEANDAPESHLLELVAENNTAVKEVEELAAIYEVRIGPITDLPPSRAAASNRKRDPWGADRPWPGTDPDRFPRPLVAPPGMENLSP